ncbi:MAG TPA: glycosyltransferase family A protein [bacterium]|nr:glycosyltransferase family A protein [bacterium]HPW39100.1 glycosyltransferase family A protein [bacterium]
MLSVIIPTYNRVRHLPLALASLARQTITKDSFEVLVIDDGSSDNTAETVKNYSELKVKYFHQNHLGVSAARNFGIEKATGDILVFFDDDAVADKNWLEEIEKIMRQEDIITGQVKPLRENLWKYFAPHYYQGEIPLESTVLLEGNCALKRAVFEKIGGFDSNLDYGHEGEEFIFRAKKNYRIMYYPQMIIYHNYAFGFINYLKKQFKFGEKAAYLKTIGHRQKNVSSANQLLEKSSLATKIIVKLLAKIGSLAHWAGWIVGALKYKKYD